MPEPSVHQHLIAGVAGGLLATVTLYPLELLKIRMQVVESATSPYRSVSTALQAVLKLEGIRGLYKGLLPASLAASGAWGGYFYFYELAKKRRLNNNDGKPLGVAEHLLSGTEAGAIVACIFNPLWLVKTRLALQGTVPGGKEYKGLTDALVTIAREEGIRGLYKGLIPALILTSHGAIQFAAYEELKSLCSTLRVDQKDQPMLVSMITGGLSKVVASTITYPYQVVKSRLQQGQAMVVTAASAPTVHHIASHAPVTAESLALASRAQAEAVLAATTRSQQSYTGTWDCFVKIWRYEGMRGYFKGLVPNLIRVAPSAAITFVTYEECLKLQQRWSREEREERGSQ